MSSASNTASTATDIAVATAALGKNRACSEVTGNADKHQCRKVLVLVNPLASKRRQRLLHELIQQLDGRNIFYSYFETLPQVEQTIVAVASLARECNEAIVLGGDGTLHQAVNALIEYRMPIGYIPCGTGNDFARYWFADDMPQSDAAWVAQALDTETQVIDVGQAGSRYFINVAGVGFDGELVKRMNNRKFFWPKLSYLLAALQAISSYQAIPFNLSKSQQKVVALGARSGFLFTLANSQFFGAGMHIAPHARLNDGRLAYCFVEKCNWFARFSILKRVGQGTHSDLAKVHCGQLNAVQVTTENLPVQADGEYIGTTPMIFRSIPAAILLRGRRNL
ncbi:hypothetical protein CWE08_03615 [Aliidiomarina iranensis]|uniref:DAGKc domain-containing protein n=1 Tax=Aliidiomarina iranensis TaxID=1434071 RepID=A0A432VZV8_9GAMM|nr:diacylglycerol kinase family protein [Aliidiomarina iranensis]RUO22287.1 hypothetical protein CWE08_03615 [Aliidiomarina iranensis]